MPLKIFSFLIIGTPRSSIDAPSNMFLKSEISIDFNIPSYHKITLLKITGFFL